MYYPKVNRGISFTKPGIYSFCLILLVGLIAISTGINALYVFLSAGLGGFIVSGLLSELAIKHYRIETVGGVLTDANAPFEVPIRIKNSSAWFSIFQMRSYFFLQEPRFQLIAKPFAAEGVTNIASLSPRLSHTAMVKVSGFPRGSYELLKTVQVTTFPFGILEKFKLDRLETAIFVAPTVDENLCIAIRDHLKKSLLKPSDDQDFFGHRPHTPSDGLRPVDWKKSAGKNPRQWVTKQFRSDAENDVMTIRADWEIMTGSVDASHYEGLLVRLRALMKVLDDSGKDYQLDFGFGPVAHGLSQSRMALARLPAFKDRTQGPATSASAAALVGRTATQEIALTLDGLSFDVGGKKQYWTAPA